MAGTSGILEPFEVEMNKILSASLASNTWNSYNNGIERFETFRVNYGLTTIWPPPVHHLANFIAYLSKMSFAPSTIRLYISSVGFANKLKGLEDTTQSFLIQKLMNGTNKLYGKADIRQPITIDMLTKFEIALKHVCFSQYEAVMFMSAFSLSFFGLLRIGEITISKACEAPRIIQYSNIEIVKESNVYYILLTIKFSKTDQFGISNTIQINEEKVNFTVCPVRTLKKFLGVRPHFFGPLYCHFNKKPVTRNQFIKVLQDCLKYLGFAQEAIKCHSFRIGGCTYLFQKGTDEAMIKKKGRWTSDCFKRYIRC